MSKAAQNILRALPLTSRQKLAECLNKSSHKELRQLPHVSWGVLNRMLERAPESFCFSANDEEILFDYSNPFRNIPWFTFWEASGDVYFRTTDVRDTSLSRVFARRELLALLKFYEIPVEYDINAHLEELREVKARLEIFRLMKNPVIDDYLRDLLYQLRYDP